MRRFPHAIIAVILLPLLAALPTGCSDDDAAPPPPVCGIEIYTPEPGAHFFSNEHVNIRWQASGGGMVSVELFKGGALVDTITSETENDGYYWWGASTLGAQSSPAGVADFALRVASTTDAACADTVPVELTNTVGCVLELTADLGTPLEAGQDFEITWESENTGGRVQIQLWKNAVEEVLVGIITADTSDDGSYLWTNVDSFNQGTGADYYLLIADTVVPGCGDVAGPFGIVDEDICYIDVTAPIADQTFTIGSTMTINFETTNSSGMVNLRLYAGGTLVPGGYIADNVLAADGTFSWLVSDFGFVGPDNVYRIIVVDAADQYCFGRSPTFTIP